MGLQLSKVELLDYDSSWHFKFLDEKEMLISLFGKDIVEIEHVGSTAISTIKSKPIIDIVVGLKKLENGEQYIHSLKSLGYSYKGHMGKSKRYFFSKGSEFEMTHHLHLVQYEDDNWNNQILFKEYILSNPDIARIYNDLKISLQVKYPNDREKYTEGKSSFIVETIREAKLSCKFNK